LLLKGKTLFFHNLTVRGFALRGFQSSNVLKVTETSKQLDDFLKHKTPRCAKPLLAEGHFILIL
jgi:hypothetical protein